MAAADSHVPLSKLFQLADHLGQKWFNLGLKLGINADKLDGFGSQPYPCSALPLKMLHTWLKGCGSVNNMENGRKCELRAKLKKKLIGCHRFDLSEKVRDDMSFDDIFKTLSPELITVWQKLAVLLGVDWIEVENILESKKKTVDIRSCAEKMLLFWSQNSRDPSFQVLIDGLEAIGLRNLAETIQSDRTDPPLQNSSTSQGAGENSGLPQSGSATHYQQPPPPPPQHQQQQQQQQQQIQHLINRLENMTPASHGPHPGAPLSMQQQHQQHQGQQPQPPQQRQQAQNNFNRSESLPPQGEFPSLERDPDHLVSAEVTESQQQGQQPQRRQAWNISNGSESLPPQGEIPSLESGPRDLTSAAEAESLQFSGN